jgi:ribonuclease HII
MKICGMDEVGRGSLAGPLVAGAVILQNSKLEILNPKQFKNLKDSKKLNKKQREDIYKNLMEAKIEYAVEIISARQINSKGMGWANKEIFRRLRKKLIADEYIADGNLKIKGIKSVIKADAKIPEVMAASIIAKVTRDKMMQELHIKYPKYHWDINVGYGTAVHIAAIREFGVVHYHRDLWVRKVLKSTVTSPL